MPQINTRILNELPEKDSFNGTIIARYVPLDLGSFVILGEHPSNTGPAVNFAFDYYAPAVVQRLGLVPEHCRFFLHLPIGKKTPEMAAELGVPAVFDDIYEQVQIGRLVHDDYNRLCADSIAFSNPNLKTARLLEKYLGHPLSKNLGRKGVFYTPAGDLLQLKISAYDGRNYYTREGSEEDKRIFGQLAGFDD